jgi:hypothetical protein
MADWLPENSIIDPEIVPLARKGFVSKVTIIESEETGGYYVTMRIKPHEEVFHLATRRIRDQPRIYMNLGRLVMHIREKMAPLKEVKLVLIPESENLVRKTTRTDQTGKNN